MVNEIEDLKRILSTKVLKPFVFKLVWSESKTLMVLTASIKYKVDIISINNLTGALPSLQFEYRDPQRDVTTVAENIENILSVIENHVSPRNVLKSIEIFQ